MSESSKASRWKPRFSLRTLVAGVLLYGALWTATEVWGGRDFQECMETRTDELRRATVAWSRTQAREAAVWQDEFYCPSPDVPLGGLGDLGGLEDVTAFCDVETLAVAPFVLRVQYTCLCVDAYGKSLPLTQQNAPDPDGEGWVLWCFGYAWGPSW